ncbi:hypothetical protein BJX63DRAFT_403912 [Aspergillus granulosus]|uniref:Nudix hydrolase domain-containing protein n=1 Tax=Aspergillus granulosus TaxID=176169 RepID=A0ABR4H4Q3_9EURO
MSQKVNYSAYTVAPHLEAVYNIPFTSFRAAFTQYNHFVGGSLIFSRTATNPERLRILLLQRASTDAFPELWEGSGGSFEDEDKTILEVVARELFEETGLRVLKFVEFVQIEEWEKQGLGLVGKFTFIIEADEARPPVPLSKEDKTLLGDEPDDGTITPGLSKHLEHLPKLDPAEHQAFTWATEEEVREGKFKSFGLQAETILKGFNILKQKLGLI